MDLNTINFIDDYLQEQDDVFSSQEFYLYAKSHGLDVEEEEVDDLLHSFRFLFPLENKNYITRKVAFQNKFFSFRPSREEVEKGHFIIGHRCMPFINPEITPDSIKILSKERILNSEATNFSMNLALDTFSLYGEGYVIPCIVSDKGNDKIAIKDTLYSLPSEISLTSWKLSDIKGGENFKYGDRIICRVTDWNDSIVEMEAVKICASDLSVKESDVERETWYIEFENRMLKTLERNGPESSIESQLAILFLENQNMLCIRDCGSVEEVLEHTSKIDIEPYGIESRIWKAGESIPYLGPWNAFLGKNVIFFKLLLIYDYEVTDCCTKNSIYQIKVNKKECTTDKLFKELSDKVVSMASGDNDIVSLNVKTRSDIIRASYEPFPDYLISDVRNRTLELFFQSGLLLSSIWDFSGNINEIPQREFIILIQIFDNLSKIIGDLEEGEDFYFSEDDISISLDGISDTFKEIESVLKYFMDEKFEDGFKIFSE